MTYDRFFFYSLSCVHLVLDLLIPAFHSLYLTCEFLLCLQCELQFVRFSCNSKTREPDPKRSNVLVYARQKSPF